MWLQEPETGQNLPIQVCSAASTCEQSRAVYDDKKSSKLLVPDALIVEPQLIKHAASASASLPGSWDMTDLKAQ